MEASVNKHLADTQTVLETRLDRGAAGEIMITVEKQMRNLVSKYLKPQRNLVSEYLKKPAVFIRDNVYEIVPPADGVDYEIVYK
jgi:hypothetical protein